MARDELYHHGIKGMRWGVRRYQNEDGSLTPKGEKRYYGKANALQKDIDSFAPIKNGLKTKKGKQILTSKDVADSVRALEKQRDAARAKGDARRERDLQKMQRREQVRNSDQFKKFAKGAAITAGVALAAYGGYKLAKAHPDAINNAKSAVSKMFKSSKKSTADWIVSPNGDVMRPGPSSNKKSLGDMAKSATSRMKFSSSNAPSHNISNKEFKEFDKMMRSDEPFKLGNGNSGKNSDIKTIKNNVNKTAVKADKSIGKAQSNLKKLQESNAKSKKELDRISSTMDEFERRMNSNEAFNLDDFGSYLMDNNKKKRS